MTPPADITLEATGATTSATLGTATVTDNLDTGLTATPDKTGPFTVATHTITWSATDNAGNTGSATQTVTVQDTTAPSITLNGADPLTVTQGTTFVDPGVAASDLVDGNIADAVVITGAVDTATPGSYTLTYTITDNAGNSAQITRTVIVTAQATSTLPGGETAQIDLPVGSVGKQPDISQKMR